jgi:hypothetical protein
MDKVTCNFSELKGRGQSSDRKDAIEAEDMQSL